MTSYQPVERYLPMPGLMYILGPVAFEVGVLVLLGYVAIVVGLDLLPLAAALILGGLSPLAGRQVEQPADRAAAPVR